MQSQETMFLRSLAAVVFGYLFMGIVVGIFFVAAGWTPEAELPEKVVRLGIAWRALVSLAAGYLAGAIGGRKEVQHALGVALLTAFTVVLSMVSGKAGQEPMWAQILNLILMFPLVLLGGYLRHRHARSQGGPGDAPYVQSE